MMLRSVARGSFGFLRSVLALFMYLMTPQSHDTPKLASKKHLIGVSRACFEGLLRQKYHLSKTLLHSLKIVQYLKIFVFKCI